MGRPHLLFVASAAEAYGSDRMLLQSVIALSEGRRITVVVPGDGPLRAELEQAGASVVVSSDFALRRRYLTPGGAVGLAARNAATLGRLLAIHRRRPVDLVVTNTQAVVVGAAFARLVRRPHVWHVHEILADPPALARGLAAAVDRLSDQVLACSTSVRDHLCALRPDLADRTVVVLNGVPTPDRAPRSGRSDRVRFGCVARISGWKGQRELLEAFALAAERLAGTGPVIELDFYGDALPDQQHLRAELDAIVRRNDLGERVRFHGFVADPAAVYDGLDVVVVPSVQPEPFSLVTVEAQLRGIPVIVPDRAGPAEIVVDGETGLQVDPRDREALAAALVRLAQDPEARRAFAEAGRARAEERFSVSRYHDDLRRIAS